MLDRTLRFLNGTQYLCIGLGTIWLLLHPPSSMGTALGFWLTLTWCALMLGSVFASVAAYRGKFTTEYVALPFFTGGLVIALSWGYAHISGENGTRIFYLTALALCYGFRWLTLHLLVKANAKPRKRHKWTGTR